MTEQLAEHGTFAVDRDTRRIRGILVPWGERSRMSASKTKPIIFPRGAVKVPRDPAVVTLNFQHDRFAPVGRGEKFEDQPHGLYAEFYIADTPEGDAWLADHGDLVKLSAEVRNIERDENDHGTAELTGAALVNEGAFASAALFAIDADPDDENETPDPAPAEPEPEADDESEEDKEETVENAEFATVPGTVPTARATDKKKPLTRRALFRMIDDVMGGRASYETRQFIASITPGEAGMFQHEGMFALADVDYDGTDGLGAKMTQSQWLGERPQPAYQQRFANLFRQESLTSLSLGGFKWGTKPAGGTWTGNKTAIPSNTPTITPVTETATRWAGGHDIAREHRDFGTPGFFESYEFWMRRSFQEWVDKTIVLTEMLAGATDLEADDPTGVDIGATLSAIVDGAAAIVDAGLTPTAAVMDTTAWKSIAKIPSSDVLGYLNAQLSLTGEGSLDTFQIVPAPVGTVTAGHVVVVARDAATVFTLPGSPIRAEALNIANGGIDIGFFGYAGFLIDDARGIQDVAPYSA